MKSIFLLFFVLCVVKGQENDAEAVIQSWQDTLLSNMNTVADFSAKVMRSTTTAFLSNQDQIFKEAVKRRIRPLLTDDKTFESMFMSINLDIDCRNPEDNIVVNDVASNNRVLLQKAINDWIKAECKKRVGLKRTFLDIDAFYDFSKEDFEDFCSGSAKAEAVIMSKLRNLATALRKADDVATEMFEDLSRTPSIVNQPLPLSFEAALEVTKLTILQEFKSRINAKPLDQACPRPDSSGQLEIVVQARPTRPQQIRTTTASTTTAATTTTTVATTTTTAGRVNQFLLNAFNLRNGK